MATFGKLFLFQAAFIYVLIQQSAPEAFAPFYVIEKTKLGNMTVFYANTCVKDTKKYCAMRSNLKQGATFQMDANNMCVCGRKNEYASCTKIAGRSQPFGTEEEAKTFCRKILQSNDVRYLKQFMVIEPYQALSEDEKTYKTFYVAITCVLDTSQYCKGLEKGSKFQMDAANNCTCGGKGQYAACSRMDGTSPPFPTKRAAQNFCKTILMKNTNRLSPEKRNYAKIPDFWMKGPVVQQVSNNAFVVRECISNTTDFCKRAKPTGKFEAHPNFECECQEENMAAQCSRKSNDPPKKLQEYDSAKKAMKYCERIYEDIARMKRQSENSGKGSKNLYYNSLLVLISLTLIVCVRS